MNSTSIPDPKIDTPFFRSMLISRSVTSVQIVDSANLDTGVAEFKIQINTSFGSYPLHTSRGAVRTWASLARAYSYLRENGFHQNVTVGYFLP